MAVLRAMLGGDLTGPPQLCAPPQERGTHPVAQWHLRLGRRGRGLHCFLRGPTHRLPRLRHCNRPNAGFSALDGILKLLPKLTTEKRDRLRIRGSLVGRHHRDALMHRVPDPGLIVGANPVGKTGQTFP
jgi:hypothetical protein